MEGKYATREGDSVEILRDNIRNGNFPIVGIITFPNGSQEQNRWQADGKYDGSEENDLDLFPVPTRHPIGWCVVDKTGEITAFFRDSDAWYRASILADTFNGDTVVQPFWED